MRAIEVMNVFSKMRSLYRKMCVQVCQRYGINQTNLDILLFLGQYPQYNTARDMCEIRGVKSGIVSVAVEQLIQKGYLERRPDERDHRIQRLFLTESGSQVVSDGKEACIRAKEKLCTGITKEEMEVLNGIIKKLAGNLNTDNQEEL